MKLRVAARSRLRIWFRSGQWHAYFPDGHGMSFDTLRDVIAWGRGLTLFFE